MSHRPEAVDVERRGIGIAIKRNENGGSPAFIIPLGVRHLSFPLFQKSQHQFGNGAIGGVDLFRGDDVGIPLGNEPAIFCFGFGRTKNAQMDSLAIDNDKRGILPIVTFLPVDGGLFGTGFCLFWRHFCVPFPPKKVKTLTGLTFFRRFVLGNAMSYLLQVIVLFGFTPLERRGVELPTSALRNRILRNLLEAITAVKQGKNAQVPVFPA